MEGFARAMVEGLRVRAGPEGASRVYLAADDAVGAVRRSDRLSGLVGDLGRGLVKCS